ncbi:hypothetical protein LEP1GSC168_0012 [Leptospira santarosai str. HAI134]|nr:hypothetical protein LEP1GSC168_0012 [Leptospira santarosai str. HAI134]
MLNLNQMQRLKEVLKETGLKSKNLAEILETDPVSFSRYVNGRRDIPVEIAYRLQIQFAYSAIWICLGEGNKKLSKNFSDGLTPKQLATVAEFEQDRILLHRINAVGARDLIERIVELKKKDRELLRITFNRLFEKKSE